MTSWEWPSNKFPPKLVCPSRDEFVAGKLRRLAGIFRQRFGYYHASVLREPLHTRIDTVRTYREERVPHCLPWPELQKLFQTMDRTECLVAKRT